MITTLLIANRGEIACRIMRSAKALGIRTVAVYSSADKDALHVRSADMAVAIGDAAAADSYLRADRVIEAAQTAGAHAIHPGYGFLAENADFAELCAQAGIIFVGPPPSAVRAMGSKSKAKALMHSAGVPVVPGYHGATQDDATLIEQAGLVGYPLLVKASAGGGGKGMRVVHAASQLSAALDSARREARSAFGDDQLLLERYVEAGRHVEIQVFFDSHGNGVHLFERDCSVQRRYQKVMEEAPAPGLSDSLRAAMYAAALSAARAVDYEGAGTVELIVGQDEFFFMEMNTRLQVEHPVTELITGVDLVEWQLRVAAGEPLPLTQSEIQQHGHAVEARVYAEDPARGFLPAVGTLAHLQIPQLDGVRVDSGVAQGDAISIHYDPMIAKVIAAAPTRAAALRRLSNALATIEIAGLTTNTMFLQRLLAHDEVCAGAMDTGLLDRVGEELTSATVDSTDATRAACVWLAHRNASAQQVAADSMEPASPWFSRDGWRMNHDYVETLEFARPDGSIDSVIARYTDSQLTLQSSAQTLAAQSRQLDSHSFELTLGDVREHVSAHIDGCTVTLFVAGRTVVFDYVDPLATNTDAAVSAGSLRAPMPGKILEVYVSPGETVSSGQSLLLMEAMKMEHTIVAPQAGCVSEVRFSAGAQVDEGVELVVVDTE